MIKVLSCQDIVTKLQENREKIQSFGVISLALFGSVARNDATDNSDLDFLVEFIRPSFDCYMDLKIFLEDLFDKPIDLVTKHSLKPEIKQQILQEAINVT